MKNIELSLITNAEDMGVARQIRQIVFVEEQQVDPEIEYDEYEDVATHILARYKGAAVGTARWRETDTGFKLERFAVMKQARGLGVGAAMVRYVMDQVDLSKTVYLNSQESALDFYAKLGFVSQGNRFYEANIPHFKMVLEQASTS